MARIRQTIIEYRNYDLPPEFPVVILTGENWRISPVVSERLHFHNCIEIGVCHEGSGSMIFADGPMDFRAGDITFVDKNVPHTTYSAPNTHSLWSYIFLDPSLLFGGALTDQIKPDGVSLPPQLLLSRAIVPERITRVILDILQEHNEGKRGVSTSVQALCLQLMILLTRTVAEQPAATPAGMRENISIAPALDYIRDNYSQDFPLDYLAELCHLSPTHFRRLFRTQTGTTPVAFLNQTRIISSCTLLRTSGKNIAEIADMVGYATLSSYNRHFAEMMDCSPREWRKQAVLPARPKVLQYTGWTEAEK